MKKISFEAIKAFIYCVNCGGFGKAAKKLNKSQATISILISNLEDDLNIRLFHRQGGKWCLTKQGEILYPYARKIVLSQQEFMNISFELTDLHEATLTLVVSDYIPTEQRERIKDEFISHVKGITLTMLSAESQCSVDMLLNRKADLIVIPAMTLRMNYPLELIARRTWFTSPLHIYCAKDHPLSQIADPAESDIKFERRIRLINGTINNHCPRPDIFTDNIFKAYSLCAQGMGWCELPEWLVNRQHQLGDDRVVKLAVSPSKKLLEFDVIYRNEPKGPFGKWFIDAVTKPQ